jgi:hypothetical protein
MGIFKSLDGRWYRKLSLLHIVMKRFLRQSRLTILMLLGSLLFASLFVSLNIVGDVFLTVTIADPPAKAPFHLEIRAADEDWPPLLSDSDFRTIETQIQQHPEVILAHRYGIGYTPRGPVVAFPEDTALFEDVQVMSGSLRLGPNETYVDLSSPRASQYHLGSFIPLLFSAWSSPTNWSNFQVNLTIVGFSELSSALRNVALENLTIPFGAPNETPVFWSIEDVPDVFICSWEETLVPLLDHYLAQGFHTSLDGRIVVRLDTSRLILPTNLDGSIRQLQLLDVELNNEVAIWNMEVLDYLRIALEGIQPIANLLIFSTIVTAAPAFVLAALLNYYVGGFVLDYRRREIHLFQVKGFRSQTLQGLQFFEAILLAGIATIVGLLLGPVSSSIIFAILGYPVSLAMQMVTLPIIILTFVLCLLTLVVPLAKSFVKENQEVLRSGLASKVMWVFFLLACYKLVGWAIGVPYISIALIDFIMKSNLIIPQPVGVLVSLLFQFLFLLDYFLQPVVPFLFLIGVVHLVIIRSSRLGRATRSLAQQVFGSVGILAARTTGRNRRQLGRIIFLLSIMIAYVIWTEGILATELDFQRHDLAAEIGADFRVDLLNLDNISERLEAIRDIEGVYAASLITEFILESPLVGSITGFWNFIAIDPETWLDVAFYEENWFIDGTPEELVERLHTVNVSMLMHAYQADDLGLSVGDSCQVFAPSDPNETIHELAIVGLTVFKGKPFDWVHIVSWDFFWSIRDLLTESRPAILVRVTSPTVLNHVKRQIKDVGSGAVWLRSYWEELQAWQTMPIPRALLEFQRVALIFCLVLTGMGTLILMELFILQRESELRLMHIRGFRRIWLKKLLLLETFAIGSAALVLGILVGLSAYFGFIIELNAFYILGVPRQVVFPIEILQILLSTVILVFGCLMIPIVHRLSILKPSSPLEGLIQSGIHPSRRIT